MVLAERNLFNRADTLANKDIKMYIFCPTETPASIAWLHLDRKNIRLSEHMLGDRPDEVHDVEVHISRATDTTMGFVLSRRSMATSFQVVLALHRESANRAARDLDRCKQEEFGRIS